MEEIMINGKKVAYDSLGEGKTVLMLHGWGTNKESLNPIAKSLMDKFHIVNVDLLGFGASDEPDEPLCAKDYSDFIKAFVEKLGLDVFACIGHSNGGRVLIKSCASHLKPEKLILIDSAGLKKKYGIDYYVKVYSYKLGKKVLSLAPFKKMGLYDKLIKSAGSEDYKNSSPVMKATMSKLLNEDLTEELSLITAETLLIWGENDTATPISDGRKMEKLIKGAGLVEIKGAGHFSYLDNFPKANAAITYFLTH